MALFNKFFFSSSNKKKYSSNTNQSSFSPHFPFDSKQIRILLYRECDASGRRLLFDSNSIQKIEINEKQSLRSNLQSNKTKLLGNLNKQTIKTDNFLNDGNFIEISNGIGYKHTRPSSSDITNIGEMVFGALAMSFRSPSLKVHWLQTPSRLLCSQVFLSPIPGTNTGCLLNQRDLVGNSSTNNVNLSSKENLKKDTSESFDGYSVNSLTALYSPKEFNRNLSMQLSALPIINDDNLIQKQSDQIVINKIQSADDITPNTIGSDSGYATISDCWTSRSSYQYSTRSSMGSVLSDPLSTYDSLRKFSLDSGKSNCDDCGVTNNSFGSSSFSTSIQQNSKTSDMSINRRIARNIQTSFENRNSVCDFVGFICDNYQLATTSGGSEGCVSSKYNVSKPSSNSKQSHSSPEMRNKDSSSYSSIYNFFGVSSKPALCKGHKLNSKRSKLGLAVCISMTETHEKEMEEFCCEHIALLESMLSRLRASAEYAYLNHKKFLKIMLHAWQKTVEWILDFFTVSRLTVPVWHSSTLESKSSKQMADNFVKEFTWLLKTLDSKDTNFFISTMITAVLTYHLGWVATITSIPSHSVDITSSTRADTLYNERQNNFKKAAEQYPYNPLWAQMCDLYGAIGSPPKVSRTIISGKDKNLIEKFLHVLSYFIRCGEVHQNDIKRKIEINSVNEIFVDNTMQYKTVDDTKYLNTKKKTSLSRKSTFQKNLSEISSFENQKVIEQQTSNHSNTLAAIDSKIDKKSLRIDNLNIQYYNDPSKNFESQEKIKVMVTTPEDVEMSLDDETFSSYSSNSNITQDGEALDAIEIQDPLDWKINNPEHDSYKKLNFWKLEAEIKEGISCTNLPKLQKTINLQDYYDVTNSKALNTAIEGNENYLFTNISKSEKYKNINFENSNCESRNIESVEENVCIEEEKFQVSQELVENPDSENFKNESMSQEKGDKGVLFVLGENDHLVNIKRSNENIAVETQKPKNKSVGSYNKKHSGVKFNLEEYSESVNTFLNKKIDFQPKTIRIEKPTNYDFWTKCTCDSNNHTPSTSSTFDLNKNKSQNNTKNQKNFLNACEFCRTNIGEIAKINDKNIRASCDERKSSNVKNKSPGGSRKNLGNSPVKKIELKDENISGLPISSRGFHLKKMFQNLKEKSRKLDHFNFKILPMPKIENSDEKINSSQVNNDKSNNLKSGFIPSLFVGVTSRYIPDMVLQGTLSSFDAWETDIKNDLVIASHCASLTAHPTENIAIIADMNKWEIKILSSQNNNASSANCSVGMSKLVSQLLEGFYILSNTGISSYECFSYLESKLKEIYMQSEVLAELLLTTEFCSLNSVTTALNLSENDVPLLLAIASIHSPQVTKRYGISFG